LAITPRQLDVAKRALAATGRKYGVALGGGNALNIHEQLIHDAAGIARETQDLDFFVSRQRNVRRAVDAVVAALEGDGYAVERRDKASGIAALGFEDAGDELAQLIVSHPDDDPPVLVEVEIAHFDYESAVLSPIGPVLSLDDLGGFKTAAFAGRRELRDPLDVAALVAAGYSPAQLIALAMARDEGLALEDFAEAAVWVDECADELFAPYLGDRDGGEVRDIAWMRRMLADWPREPLHAD
jgi:nucleotidyltransferase AbiEii toxin of type IV toxin-antitoxin system